MVYSFSEIILTLKYLFFSALSGIVTYSRRYLPDNEMPFWLKSTNQLTNLYVTSAGTIEGDGDGMLQVDFANK